MTVHTDTRSSMLAHIVQRRTEVAVAPRGRRGNLTSVGSIEAGVADLDAKHPGCAIDVPNDV